MSLAEVKARLARMHARATEGAVFDESGPDDDARVAWRVASLRARGVGASVGIVTRTAGGRKEYLAAVHMPDGSFEDSRGNTLRRR